MKKKYVAIIGLIIMLGFGSQVAAQETNTQPAEQASSDVIASMLQEANGYYDQRGGEGMIESAIAGYKKILEKDPVNYEATWRLGQALFWKSDHVMDSQKALEYLSEAEKLTKKIIEIYPKGVDGQYWYAVSLGRAAERRGILNSLFAIGPMHDTMMKVIELDPEHGFAYYLLGVLYRKAPGWPISLGDIKKSLKYAKLAVKYEPDVTLTNMGYAEVLQAMGNKEEAKKLYEKILEMPGKPDMQPETAEDKEKIKAILAKM